MQEKEILEIIERQKAFFKTGQTLEVSSRIRYLKALRQSILEHLEEIHEGLKKDLGKSRSESYMCETGLVLSELTYMIKHVRRFSRQKSVPTPLAQSVSRSFRIPSPYGTVLVMNPWNYPFLLSMDPLIDAVAAGNTVVLKTSSYSPNTNLAIRRVIQEVFPTEYVAVIFGGSQENTTLIRAKFDYVFFTGSKKVGKLVYENAASRLTPVTLELGGKSPCIVDETADLPLAARRIVWGKFLNLGQTCVAPDYIFCAESVHDRLVEELKKQIVKQFGENPLENPDYGKMINEKHFQRVCGLVDAFRNGTEEQQGNALEDFGVNKEACDGSKEGGGSEEDCVVSKGACAGKGNCTRGTGIPSSRRIFGGKNNPSTLQIEPTILDQASFEDAVMQEEIFGPVLPILTYREEAEIISYVTEHDAPLAFYLFSSDKKRIRRLTAGIGFGGGCINDVVIHLATSHMPFGGFRESGMGSYHGKTGFDTFTHYKSMVDKKTFLDLPMRYQPYKPLYDRLVKLFLR